MDQMRSRLSRWNKRQQQVFRKFVSEVEVLSLDGNGRFLISKRYQRMAEIEQDIKFVGMGEKMNELEPFHPDRMASRILGMGDMMTLIEEAEAKLDEEKAIELEKKLRKNQFTLEDFLDQMQQVKKMGGLTKIISMLPGANTNQVKEEDIEKGEREFVIMEAIINSMTKEERNNPSVLNGSRR
jgi:signal recognition particle subunit SRP54